MAIQQPCVRSLAAIAKRRLADKYDAALKAGYAENVEEYATTCPGIWALTGVLWSHAARPVVPPGQDTAASRRAHHRSRRSGIRRLHWPFQSRARSV